MRKLLPSAAASLLMAVAAIAALPFGASAHVKWFVREGAAPPGSVAQFSLHEPAVQLWIAVILVTVALALALDRYLPRPPERIVSFGRAHRQQITDLFQVMLGVALLVTAVKGAIFAPHLAEARSVGLLLRFLEGVVGVLLIGNKAVRAASVMMIVLFLASAARFGFVSSLEYFNFLGVALYLLFTSFAADGRGGGLRPYAVPLMRIHLGVALGVLAWTEKLIDPTLATTLLETHQLNFMSVLGAGVFSDRLFVLCAGCTELLFAIIFVLGLVTRINTVVLAGFLLSSNLYFFAVGKTDEAFVELTGHLPLLAIALMLMFHGGGSKLRLTNLFVRRTHPGAPLGVRAAAEHG